MKKTVYIFGAAVLIICLVGLYRWLSRPLPVPFDDPKAQAIKDVLVKSHKIEYLLYCDPNADVKLLNEVYKDTVDYRPTGKHRMLIARYLGEKALDGAGYLTYIKAYSRWRRSGEPYPSTFPATISTLDSLYTPIPTSKPVADCPDPLEEPELRYVSIAIREDKAIVVYEYSAYRTEALLRKVDGVWFIVSSRNILIIA